MGDYESWKENNKKLLEKTDPAAVEEVVKEQIELMGSQLLYQRINKNFLEHKFEAIFAKEQFKLFAWRENFFYSKFGYIWDELDSDDNYPYVTVPYHITMNFEEVTALACSTDYRPHNHSNSYVFFQNEDELSSSAKAMFDPDPLNSPLWDWHFVTGNRVILNPIPIDMDAMEESGLTFKDVAAMIMALHHSGPCTLLETAMKAVVLHGLPIYGLPRELQKKALHGPDILPSNLTTCGRSYFHRYRYEFSAESETQSHHQMMSQSHHQMMIED